MFDPIEFAEQIIESGFQVSSKVFEDEKDIPVASNVVEFMLDPKFLDWKPFPRQIQVAMHAFMDFCPLCSNKRYVNSLYDQPLEEILDNIVFLHYGVCPKCGLRRDELIKYGKLKGWINEVVGVAGQRSSKSHLTVVLSLYLLHRFLMLPKVPYDFFGLSPTVLHLTFVAITHQHAVSNLWMPFKEYYERAPWFQTYNRFLNEKELEIGQVLYENKQTYLWYKHKGLLIYPSTPDMRKLRGPTRFGFAIDEFAYFDSSEQSKSVKLAAYEIYRALTNSLATIRASVRQKRESGFYDILDAYGFLISSPRTKRDYIMKMLGSAKDVPSRYAFHYATWEFNPNISFEDLRNEFVEDPVRARRDFGADPPLNDAPALPVASVKNLYKKSLRYQNIFFQRQLDDGSIKLELRFKLKTPFVVLGLDAGFNRNSFAFCLLYVSGEKIKVVGLGEVIPISTPVNFPKVGDSLIKVLSAATEGKKYVAADRWNSIYLLQRFSQELEADVEQISLSYDELRTVLGLINDGKVVVPKSEVDFGTIEEAQFDYPSFFLNKPVAHFLYQLLTIRETGMKIDKGVDSTDDLFRAFAVATIRALEIVEEEEGYSDLDEESAEVAPGKIQRSFYGTVRTYNYRTRSLGRDESLRDSRGRPLAVLKLRG